MPLASSGALSIHPSLQSSLGSLSVSQYAWKLQIDEPHALSESQIFLKYFCLFLIF